MAHNMSEKLAHPGGGSAPGEPRASSRLRHVRRSGSGGANRKVSSLTNQREQVGNTLSAGHHLVLAFDDGSPLAAHVAPQLG
jgi:hypothetical protein